MESLIFLVLIVVLVFMIFQNIKLFKRSKHIKDYVTCSDAIFDEAKDSVEIISSYIEREQDHEFKEKGRVILLYALMDAKMDAGAEASKLEIKDMIIGKKGNFDPQKFEYNSDSFFWIVVDLIKAHVNQDEAVIKALNELIAKYEDMIGQDLVIKLFHEVDQIMSGSKEDYGFLKDLWNGNYPAGSTYDKRLVGFYKYIAISIIAYKGDVLAEEMVADLQNFANMKAGRVVMKDLGILDTYLIKDEDDEELDDKAKIDIEKEGESSSEEPSKEEKEEE